MKLPPGLPILACYGPSLRLAFAQEEAIFGLRQTAILVGADPEEEVRLAQEETQATAQEFLAVLEQRRTKLLWFGPGRGRVRPGELRLG